MVQNAARKSRGRTAQAQESYEVIRAQEALVVEVQTGIARALRERNLKQIDLADRLGVSQARVSQMFGDDAQNLTLRTLAKIYHVLGSRCKLIELPANAAASIAAVVGATDQSPMTEAMSEAHASGKIGLSSYRFHRPPTSDQLTAQRKFEVRRRCSVSAPVAELAYA